jgi:hypothetical protein
MLQTFCTGKPTTSTSPQTRLPHLIDCDGGQVWNMVFVNDVEKPALFKELRPSILPLSLTLNL